MNNIKAIIVDDESAARDVLHNLILRSKCAIDIIDHCIDIEQAVSAIKSKKPDVVFLDIQMPNYAGYEIASFFDSIDFEIIFVTAYDQYAIKAFELSAIDYLVKPINRLRLQEALDKLTERIEKTKDAERFHILMESMKEKKLGKIVISELGQKRIVSLSEIIAIEAKGAYSLIHLKKDDNLLVSKNLKHFESILPEGDVFFRAHKSWIISVKEVDSFNKNQGDIVLTNDVQARLSRNRMTDFEKIME